MDKPAVGGFFVAGGKGKDVTVSEPNRALARIPRGVWVLGFVSMLMDVSSEMIHALLPVYLVTVLGTSRGLRLSLRK